MTADQAGAPVVLLHHLKHNKGLHEQVILLSITSAAVPVVDETARVTVASLDLGFHRVTASYGFMETPNVPHVLDLCAVRHGLKVPALETSYFLNRERLLPTGKGRMARWRKKLFAFMARNAQSATQYFGIPPNRVVELGAQVEL